MRTISGEMPRRFAEFPDSVRTFPGTASSKLESDLHLSTMRSMGGEVADASGVTTNT